MQDQFKSEEKANNYERFRHEKKHHKYVTVPSVRKLLGGDLNGKRCLDIACGSGQSTRILADMNPVELIGLDISEQMIELARQLNTHQNSRYFVKDCSQTDISGQYGQFDLVFSMHFMNYAERMETLENIVRAQFEATRPGGTCAGLLLNPFMKPGQTFDLLKYGLQLIMNSERDITTRFFDTDHDNKLLIELKTHLWEPGIYEKCFMDAGFENFKWVDIDIDENYDDKDNFLKEFVETKPSIMFKMSRPKA